MQRISCVMNMSVICGSRNQPTHCMEKYGVQQHVFTGVCVRLNGTGGASLQLDDNNIFYAANDERHMFTRIDNK